MKESRFFFSFFFLKSSEAAFLLDVKNMKDSEISWLWNSVLPQLAFYDLHMSIWDDLLTRAGNRAESEAHARY